MGMDGISCAYFSVHDGSDQSTTQGLKAELNQSGRGMWSHCNAPHCIAPHCITRERERGRERGHELHSRMTGLSNEIK